jgi:hypothetical protein
VLQRPGGKKRQQQEASAPPALPGAGAGAGAGAAPGGEEEPLLFSECNPLVLAQLREQPCREFPTFDAALDEFFSKVGAPGRQAVARRKAGWGATAAPKCPSACP